MGLLVLFQPSVNDLSLYRHTLVVMALDRIMVDTKIRNKLVFLFYYSNIGNL